MDSHALRKFDNMPISVIGYGGTELRGKVISTDSDDLLHIRAVHNDLHIHTVLDGNGSLVAFACGKTDGDAWSRIEGELKRKLLLTDN